MEQQPSITQRLREQISGAMDLKEAASHVQAPDKEELRAVEEALEDAFESSRPEHESLEKLISLKDSFKAAHVDLPEEELWREEMDEAMK